MRCIEAFNETNYPLDCYGIFEDGWNAAIKAEVDKIMRGRMVQKIKQTRKEKIAGYMSLPKKDLAEMLFTCNELIGKLMESQKPISWQGNGQKD